MPETLQIFLPVLKTGVPFPAEGVDRLILDRRRRNAREKRTVSRSRFMPHSALLGEMFFVFLEPHQELRMSADDLRAFYHLITGSDQRAATTPVGPSLAARNFRRWNAYDPSWPDREKIHLCWPSPDLGDFNAVDIAQELHINVVKISGWMQRESTFVHPKPVPFNESGFFQGIMIDYRVGVQVIETQAFLVAGKPRPNSPPHGGREREH